MPQPYSRKTSNRFAPEANKISSKKKMIKERFFDPTSITTENASHAEKDKDALNEYVIKVMSEAPLEHDKEFLMEGISGFSPSRLVAKYILIEKTMSLQGFTRPEINSVFTEIIETDTRAYAAEFLYRSPVLQTEYQIRNINEVPTVVMPRYDANSPLHSHVSLKEREGASFYGVLNLEQAILESNNNSTVFYGSPSGWNGTGIPFEECQMHVVNIVDKKIIDTVLRTSLSLNEIKTLMEELGEKPFSSKENTELIKEISQTAILRHTSISPEDVLNRMQKIANSDTAWNRMKISDRNIVFDKAFSFYDISECLRKKSFLQTNNEVNAIILDLSNYLKVNSAVDDESLRKMVRSIGKAALTISESIGVEVGDIDERKTQNSDYTAATKYASEGLGCESPSSTQSRESQYSKEGLDGRCTQCGESTKVICGWCIKCAAVGENYKKHLLEGQKEEYQQPQKSSVYGTFLGAIIVGAFTMFSKN